MNIGVTHIAIMGASVSFMSIGLSLRKQKKKWKVFFFGGIALFLLVILSLALGVSL
jgi:hypothetical protein